MMDAIIIDYDVFAKESRLYVMKDGRSSNYKISSNIESLVPNIIDMAQQTGIYNVKVHAPSAFINEIDRQVKQLETTTYAEYKISIEGI